MKHQLDLTVTHNVKLSPRCVLMKLTQADPLPEMQPGQFVQILIEQTPGAFLRRPISIHYVDKARNELWLLVQQVGKGTNWLCSLPAGSKVNMLIPLGKGFSLAPQGKPLLVGGGVGVAPLLYLGRMLLDKGVEPTFLLGARTATDMVQLSEFEKYGPVHVTTEDGTQGEKGFVTQHSVWEAGQFGMVYACGPMPMMQGVARLAHAKQMPCEVSLENKMACGIGACLCCVEPTRQGNLCVCKEGPVFNIEKLSWQI